MGLKESGLRGSLRNVSVGIDAIPDDAIAQYDATQESYADGESFSTITDQIGDADMTGGSGEFTTSGINGNASFDLNGFSSAFSADGNLIIEDSFTCLTVVELIDDDPQGRILDRDAGNLSLYWNNGEKWQFNDISGDDDPVVGSNDSSKQLIGITKDGSTNTIREDGVEMDSRSDTSTGGTTEPNIQGANPWNGYIGEIIFYEPVLSSSELDSEEQRLADKWGITLD